MKQGKFCHRVSDIPATAHWALIENRAIYVPGDERSRTNPGHGYPGGKEDTLSYIAYTDEETFRQDMLKQAKAILHGTIIAVFVAQRYNIKLSTTVEVEP